MVLIGLFIGGLLPYLFSALTMTAVGQAASEMVEEIRRQFRDIPGLRTGQAEPDNTRCMTIATNAALRRMIGPGLLAVVIPPVVGFSLGAYALGGLIGGALLSGVLLALMMANAGGAWDNAKKYVEKGNLGGKGSPTHNACIVGDTVGDPFKDTSGPSLNILIKLMAIVSLVLAPYL
jgi:K(+)-stimulated pyrophosphate-energized sodium pump